MKTIHYLSIIILSFSSQILLAQNDTLVGVLRDISDKITLSGHARKSESDHRENEQTWRIHHPGG